MIFTDLARQDLFENTYDLDNIILVNLPIVMETF